MTVQDVLNAIKAQENYVPNSLINKSFDDNGCTYKFLSRSIGASAIRREIFISTSTTGTLEGRTVIESVEISEPI